MRILKCGAALAVAFALSAGSASASTLWYNGDFGGGLSLANEQNTEVASAYVYDNFLVGAGGWTIDSIWSNNLTRGLTATDAYWEIRSGVTAGDGGTLVASGTSSVTQTLTGRSYLGFDEYNFLVGGLDIFLAPGTYWLMVAPIGSGEGRSFVTTTTNLNGVGTFLEDGSFFDSAYFLNDFDPASVRVGYPADFSMGVGGIVGQVNAVPEPSALMLTGTALLLSLRASRRRLARK